MLRHGDRQRGRLPADCAVQPGQGRWLHAFQSILLTIAWVVFLTIYSVVVGILGLYVLYALTPLLNLVALLAWLFLRYSAYQGKKVAIPIIGPIAEKQA